MIGGGACHVSPFIVVSRAVYPQIYASTQKPIDSGSRAFIHIKWAKSSNIIFLFLKFLLDMGMVGLAEMGFSLIFG
ncbi:hypothetical protein [Alysiella filiformis]|uniref:hypothetical protein n=1 Tax=Alysiella filiformis TaxID=194196 RepID=UPI000BE45918|nr:hypothetical protein [Alysiella filiformis]QMT31807.1 hypothetical protein H3L97_02660 [Alysiella filiformis]